MLPKLDRYIIGKFLATFFFTCLVFTILAFVIDFAEKVEEFIDEPVTVAQVAFEYYLPFFGYINAILWPMFTLIAVVFFTTRMAGNNEIISMLNAGVSFNRLLRPYLIAAGIIGGLHLLMNHLLVPYGNISRLDFEHAYVWKESDKGKKQNVHMFLDEHTKIYVRYYSKRDTSARDMRIETFDGNRLVSLVKAGRAIWLGPPNRWRLQSYEIRTFDGMDETIRLGKNSHIDTTLRLYPDDFVRYDNTKEMIPTPRLASFIAQEKQRGIGNTRVFEIEQHRRTADTFTIFILTLIGISVAARKTRGGLGINLVIGIIIGLLFVFLSRFSITFAQSDALPILLGVWLPNILFGSIAAFLVSRAQK